MSATIIALPNRLRTRQPESPTRLGNPDVSDASALRRARIRIAQLEASLTQAHRDSLTHFTRARDAERRLREAQSPCEEQAPA